MIVNGILYMQVQFSSTVCVFSPKMMETTIFHFEICQRLGVLKMAILVSLQSINFELFWMCGFFNENSR